MDWTKVRPMDDRRQAAGACAPGRRRPQAGRHQAQAGPRVSSAMDGFGSDTNEFESGYHLLPHFNSTTNTNPNLLEYEYKTNGSNSNSHSDVYSESTRNYFPKI